jgi:hypothetical protein
MVVLRDFSCRRAAAEAPWQRRACWCSRGRRRRWSDQGCRRRRVVAAVVAGLLLRLLTIGHGGGYLDSSSVGGSGCSRQRKQEKHRSPDPVYDRRHWTSGCSQLQPQYITNLTFALYPSDEQYSRKGIGICGGNYPMLH